MENLRKSNYAETESPIKMISRCFTAKFITNIVLKSGDNWLKGRGVTGGQFLKKFGRKIDEVRRKKVHNILEALHIAMSPPAKLLWPLVS